MRWEMLLIGLALFMVFEGMAPFAAPAAWRRAVARLAAMPDRSIRIIGGIVMTSGVVLLLAVTTN